MTRNLITFCDGTWKTENDPAETNVVRLWRAVASKSPHGEVQIKHYDRGVGTGGIKDRLLGGITGKGLEKNVKDAYAFLAVYAPRLKPNR